MKWWRPFLLSVSLFLLQAGVLWPAVSTHAADQNPAAVRVAYCRDCIPFHFTNAAGHPDGMVIDKWKLWSEKTGLSVDYIPASWDDTLELVKNGGADAHAGLFFNESRDKFLDFGLPLIKSDTHIFYDKSLPVPADMKSFKAYRIGVLKGDFVVSWFTTYMPEFTLVLYDNYEEIMEDLKAGELMVFAADTLTGLHYLGRHDLRRQFVFRSNDPIYSNSFYPAVKQGNTGLLKTIMKGMGKISATESKQIAREWASGTRQEDTGALIIAMDRDYPPLTMVDSDGNPGGLLVDMWRLWSDTTGLKIRFRPSSWAESVAAVRSGSADIHSGLFKNEAREAWMAFSDPIHRAQSTLYFNTGDGMAPLEELAGQPVAVLEGSFQADWLKEHYPDIQPVYCADSEKLIITLLKKTARAVFHETMVVEAVVNRLGLAGKIKKSPETILSNAIYAGVPRFNDTLLSLVNDGFSGISKEELTDLELQWIPRKENRFYAGQTGDITLTRAEKEFIADHPPLAFSEVDWQPLSIVNGSDEFRGMIADYLDTITRKTGLRFSFTPSDTWSRVLDRYKSGDIDMIPALGENDETGRPVHLSQPFVNFPLVIVTRDDVSYIAGTSQLNGRKVAVGKGYTSYHYLKNDFPEIDLVQTDDVKTGLMALTNRQVDAFVGHMAVVIHTIQESGFTNLKIAGETDYIFNHRIGVDPAYPLAVSIINKALNSMTEEDHRAIYQRWLSLHYEQGMDVWLIAKILGAALVLFVIVMYWNRRLAREVTERKRTEQRLLESERKTRAMSEAIHDGLVMIDGEARVMYWNHAAEELFDIPAGEAMGRDMHALFAPEEFRARAGEGLKRFSQTGQGPVVGRLQELEALKKDGTRFPVEVGVSAFQVGDNWYAVGTIRDITERNKAQETVQKIRTELQQIFDNAHVGILLLKGRRRIYRCNVKTAEILGYDSPRDMVGMRMNRFHMSEDDFQAFGDTYYARLAKGEQVHAEYQLKRRDGTGIWCSFSGKALDTAMPPDMEQGVIWVIDDISEKRAARQALKESEKRVNTILESVNTGILIIDPETRTIVDVNPAAARMIGLSRTDIVNRKCHQFVCPRAEHDCPVIDNMERIENAERVLITGDGREVPILKTVVPVMLGGRKQFLESFVDITGQKAAENELQDNLKELERFYNMAIGREEKMIDLKAEINALLVQAGEKEKYKIR
ncbi:MAG: transporter substrate-binding domain-containing protein [Desulfobacterales bacterium]|nr:transporter substrate-binding domain-containing protein [Desulfobacterales bacterium]